jgi:hemerythrin superfamily protein
MNAIELLTFQHREVAELFETIENAESEQAKQEAFETLADSLAAHATIEEHQFYPAVKARRTEDILLESLEEHLGIKRVLVDLLKTSVDDETFPAKLKVLKEQVEHHVGEEEGDLFPKVKKVLDKDELEALGQELMAEYDALLEGHPREQVPSETDEAAPL